MFGSVVLRKGTLVQGGRKGVPRSKPRRSPPVAVPPGPSGRSGCLPVGLISCGKSKITLLDGSRSWGRHNTPVVHTGSLNGYRLGNSFSRCGFSCGCVSRSYFPAAAGVESHVASERLGYSPHFYSGSYPESLVHSDIMTRPSGRSLCSRQRVRP